MSHRVVLFAALVLVASASLAAGDPAATLTITDTNRTASASGGPFFVPNESYTLAFIMGLLQGGNSDSFTCDALATPATWSSST